MTEPTPQGPLAAAHAREAFDEGDHSLQLARLAAVGGPQPTRRSAHATRDDATPSATPEADGEPSGRASLSGHSEARRRYQEAHDHYLNAASLCYTGAPRGEAESSLETIERLPSPIRESLGTAYRDFHRDVDASGSDTALERTADYVSAVRAELEASTPGAFRGRDLATADTVPTR
jgi:hypothetical protein